MTQLPTKPKCINCGYEILDPKNHSHEMPPTTEGVCDHCGHDRNDPQDMIDTSCGCVCHDDNYDEADVDITIITLTKEPDNDN